MKRMVHIAAMVAYTAAVAACGGAATEDPTARPEAAAAAVTLANADQIGASPWQTMGDLKLTLNAAAAPDGTTHATRAVSGGNGHALVQIIPVTPGASYTFTFYARNNGGTRASYSAYDNIHYRDIVAP